MKNIKKIALSTFIVFLAVFAFKYFSVKEEAPLIIKKAKGVGSYKAKREKKVLKVNSDIPLIEGQEYADPEKKTVLEELNKEWSEIKQDIDRRKEKCEEAAEKLFSNNNLIDVNDEFYKKPNRVLEKLHDTFSKTLRRQAAVEGYGVINEMITKDLNFDPKAVFDSLGELDICRPNKSMNYLETVFEAVRKNKYSSKVKQEIFYITQSMLESTVRDQYDAPNLMAMIGFVKMMAENEVLPKEVLPEVQRYYRKLIEQEKTFRREFQENANVEQNRIALKEDFLRKKDIGLELKEYLRELKSKHAPDFN